MPEIDPREPNESNSIPKVIISPGPDPEKDVDVIPDYHQSKKASFFIGDADTKITKVHKS